MKDAETRLPARAMVVLLAVTVLLSGFLLWRQIGSRVLVGAAAIQIARNPDIRLIDYRAFPTCQKTERYAALDSRLARAVALDPGNRAAWQYLVKVRWASGDCAAVEQMLAARSAHDDPSLALIAALLDIQSDQFKGRASYPQAADMGKLLADTGKDADEAGLVDEALPWYSASFWLDPNLEVAEWLVSQYTTQANMLQVNWVWEYMAQEKAGTDDGWWAQFRLAELAGDANGQISALEAGAEVSTDSYQFLIELGHAYRKTKRYTEAIEIYQRAETLRRDLVWPLVFQGEVFLEIGELEKAQERLTSAQSIDPTNGIIFYHMSLTHYQMGDVEAAFSHMQTAIELRLRTGIKPWTMSELLGNWYLNAGRCAEAKAAFTQALEWQPNETSLIDGLRDAETCSKN